MALLRALSLGIAIYAAAADAQLAGTVSVVSDYRFRGVSLSQQHPAAQATIGYDHPSGWYGGLFGSTVEIASDSTTAQAVAYVGMTTPIDATLHWDFGADYSGFSGNRDYDYGEIYAGIASAQGNARVHFSPNYFGLARDSFYLELNGTRPFDNGLIVLGHLGWLVPTGPGAGTVSHPVDARVGIGFDVAGFAIQIAWVGIKGRGKGELYPVYSIQRRNTVVASISRSF